jgi:inner membrane protein
MPTIFSHAIFASAVGSAFSANRAPARFWVLTVFCPVLPDADVIAFAFRVGYPSMFGHRGITHSIAFAVLIGCLAAAICFRSIDVAKWKLILYFTAITFSHSVLDMFTNGGLGVALLAPISDQRFFFPWRPIQVSPIGRNFFSDRGLAVIASELVWIWIPSATIILVSLFARRVKRSTE